MSTDLAHATDAELDRALERGWKAFAAAKGDKAEQARIHAGTQRILDIQEERRHVWLDHTLGLE